MCIPANIQILNVWRSLRTQTYAYYYRFYHYFCYDVIGIRTLYSNTKYRWKSRFRRMLRGHSVYIIIPDKIMYTMCVYHSNNSNNTKLDLRIELGVYIISISVYYIYTYRVHVRTVVVVCTTWSGVGTQKLTCILYNEVYVSRRAEFCFSRISMRISATMHVRVRYNWDADFNGNCIFS